VKTQVAQYNRPCTRYATAWPGEIAKLFMVMFMVGLSWGLFRSEFDLRKFCSQCALQCDLQCSKSFQYCAREENLPLLHTLNNQPQP